uniref:ribosomal protein S2 n=1 Tax=Phytophthora pinifolia TaxID=538568 RepID=UPI002028B403|nr:ribosomal protein S2 [Phytophthora pinifolia]DAZ88543.1 TPA_asm: ribosomal protein S2 [Phytophthora pinifolia]
MIQKKKNINNNVLLNLLFKSKTMYGESLASTNKEILPFIYASRHDYTIINLKDVSFFLKRIFKLIKYMVQKKKRILVIGNNDEVKFLLTKEFKNNNPDVIFFKDEWLNGLITNKIKDTTLNKAIHYLLKENDIKLILIIKSSIKDTFLNQELSTLKIPTISLINTSQTLKNIDYPIITNSRNIRSIHAVMYLLHKMSL